MSLLDDLHSALRGAQLALDTLGPRPIGDPRAIKAAADRVREAGDAAAHAATSAAAVPDASTLSGRSADQLRAHSRNAVGEARSAAAELHDIADFLGREVKRVQREIDDWELGRRKANNTINEIKSAIGRVL
ncbi:MAG: hypothetical protein PGN13_08865 [Patulibacter minatonensis]